MGPVSLRVSVLLCLFLSGAIARSVIYDFVCISESQIKADHCR